MFNDSWFKYNRSSLFLLFSPHLTSASHSRAMQVTCLEILESISDEIQEAYCSCTAQKEQDQKSRGWLNGWYVWSHVVRSIMLTRETQTETSSSERILNWSWMLIYYSSFNWWFYTCKCYAQWPSSSFICSLYGSPQWIIYTLPCV